MSKTFSELSGEEQKGLIEKIGNCLKENGFGDVPVTTEVENVGILMAGQKEFSTSLKVEKKLKSTDGAKGEEVTKKIQDLLKAENVDGVQVKLMAAVGPGEKYKTIENVVKINTTDEVNLEHK